MPIRECSASAGGQLEQIVANWGRLPDIVRNGILAMVDAVLHGAAPQGTPSPVEPDLNSQNPQERNQPGLVVGG
jgi:hypothetical protein